MPKLAAGIRADARLHLSFEDMPADQQRITLTNVRHDMLAVALFADGPR